MLPADQLQGRLAVRRLVDVVARIAQGIGDHLANGRIVVDHQHARHRPRP
jgi:hypothetical protein